MTELRRLLDDERTARIHARRRFSLPVLADATEKLRRKEENDMESTEDATTEERRLRLYYRHQPSKQLIEDYRKLPTADRRMVREVLFERGQLYRLHIYEELRQSGV